MHVEKARHAAEPSRWSSRGACDIARRPKIVVGVEAVKIQVESTVKIRPDARRQLDMNRQERGVTVRGMYETAEDLARLQDLLDRSHDAAGQHLRSIITADRRLEAEAVAARLPGMCLE
jgi:hypothetical protein